MQVACFIMLFCFSYFDCLPEQIINLVVTFQLIICVTIIFVFCATWFSLEILYTSALWFD